MPSGYRERPPWLMRVDGPSAVAGAGLLVAADLVLTCAHVVAAALETDRGAPEPPDGTVTLAFAHSGERVAGRVEFWIPAAPDLGGDVAVIRLERGAEAVPAPLRAPESLAGRPYVIQGFPHGRRHPVEATGLLGGRAGPHWTQMDGGGPTGFSVDAGFSGAPVWDAGLEAVVGMAVAYEGDPSTRVGYMLPLAELGRMWPGLRDLLGFRLDLDPSFDLHWLPRAQGLSPYESLRSQDAWHFVGRERALSELADWLNGPAASGRGVRVVTGGPGSGKSAVLARTVVLADRIAHRLVPPETLPPGVPTPRVGCVDVAVHARGQSVESVVERIADAVGIEAGDPVTLVRRLHRRAEPLTVVVDALDEAGEAAASIAGLLGRIAADPTGCGLRVLVGTRLGPRGAPADRLLGRLGAAVVIDLDGTEPDPRTGLRYLEHADLRRYVERRLAGTRHVELAGEIAAHAEGNFLVAQVAAATVLAAGDAPWRAAFPTDLGTALDDYLERRFTGEAELVRDLLTPLAFVEHPGLGEGPLWLAAARALSSRPRTEAELGRTIASAGSYLMEETSVDPPVFRLFHDAFKETLRAQYAERFPSRNGHRLVYEALLEQVPRDGDGSSRWEDAEDYLRQNMMVHAMSAGRLDDLVQDVGYLVVAPPERLLLYLDHLVSEPARAAGFVYRRASHQFAALTVPERAAALALAARQAGFPALADRAEARFAVPWSGLPVAWEMEHAEQTIGSFADLGTVLWIDPQGKPAAFSDTEAGAALFRVRDHLLELEEMLPTASDGEELVFEAQAVRVLDDGREVGVSLDVYGVLRKWTFTGGLRLTGELSIGGMGFGSYSDVGLAVDADGRLLAAVMAGGEVHLLDVDGDVPRLLDTVALRSWRRSNGTRVTIGVQDGLVHVAWFEEKDALAGSEPGEEQVKVHLATVVGDRLVPCGAPLTEHEYNPAALRFLTRPDGTLLLVSASATGVLLSSVTRDGLTAGPLLQQDIDVISVAGAVLPDGRSLAVFGDLAGFLSVWEVGEALTPIGGPRRGHEYGVDFVALGCDASGEPVLLSASALGSDVRIWRTGYRPPEPVEPPQRYGGFVARVALLPDGPDHMIAAAVNYSRPPELLVVTDRRLEVWNVEGWPSGDDTSYGGTSGAVAVAYAGETDVLVALRDYQRLRVWRVVNHKRVELLDMAGELTTDGAVAVTEIGEGGYLVAVGDGRGAVSCLRIRPRRFGRGFKVEEVASRRAAADAAGYENRVSQLEFVLGPKGDLRLLGVCGNTALLWDVPPKGALPVLDTLERVSRVAVAWDGAASVVLAFGDREKLSLHRLDRDRFAPFGEPWTSDLDMLGQVGVTVRPDGTVLTAAGDVNGRTRIWRHPPERAPVPPARVQVGSSVQGLRWTLSGALVVWCHSGVVRLTGDW